MDFTFICACISITIGFLVYVLYFKKMRSIKKNIFLVLLTGISAMTFLVYPLQQEYENIFTRIMASFIYAFKCAGMGQNLQILSRIDMNSIN